MSERILRALMQLFAIIAQVDENDVESGSQEIRSSKGRKIIQSFLRSELSSVLVEKYLNLFDEYLVALHQKNKKKDGVEKRTSLNSVKVLRICAQINEELTQKQKIIVLIRIIEYILSNDNVNDQEVEFVNTVAESFNVPKAEYELITDFVLGPIVSRIDSESLLYVSSSVKSKDLKSLVLPGLDDEIRILHLKSINTLFFRYFGKEELNLNGQFVPSDRTHILTQGSTVRTQKSKHLYYSDAIKFFINLGDKEALTFSVNEVLYEFKGGKRGLHPFSFIEESGKLVGIMGGSGTGKSTLMNVLNGSYPPSSGSVLINGINIHEEKDKLQGIIGFVSQDDLLIEELSVYQNLYFNAKLCFSTSSENEIKRKVIEILQSIGLYEVRNLVVGSPLEKTISGGQRKRLNIALELIREPEVLFVDEPTSGLSSRDSENIMDLLKEMTFKGKLVFVVIHQPSSDIYKMFDRLLLIDQGGYPVFDGNPIDAIVYFKHHIHHGNAEERECELCGNVNPEQLFNIIDTKIIDEYGNQTNTRKTTPEEWYTKYRKAKKKHSIEERKKIPKAQTSIPNRLKQFKVFFLRDLLSKISNIQYVLITFLEAPALAAILSFFVKYYNQTSKDSNTYSFFFNENIPQYIFISVVVALFLGMTVAAEEIHKDRKILKRETFLNLSKGSYLLSKVSILFIISLVQSLTFVLIGNYILEIQDMWWQYWLVLFSASCVANMIGLNISSGFNSAKVIYIIVPILIIPQLLFSGVIVKFDRLHPVFSKSTEVPWIGNLMVSRWAYEAMAVTQCKDNELEKDFFELKSDKYYADWKKDYWVPEMENQMNILLSDKSSYDSRKFAAHVLKVEIDKEEALWDNLKCENCKQTIDASVKNPELFLNSNVSSFIDLLKRQYIKTSNDLNDRIELKKQEMGIENFKASRDKNVNEALTDVVTNHLETDKFVTNEDGILRKDNLLYLSSANKPFLLSHFYTPEKNLFGLGVSTLWGNIIVLWIFVSIFFIALYYDWVRKFMKLMEYWKNRALKKSPVTT